MHVIVPSASKSPWRIRPGVTKAPPLRRPVESAMRRRWPIIKDVFKEQYLVLTDDDLIYCEGCEAELLEHLVRKTGRPQEEFERLIQLETAAK